MFRTENDAEPAGIREVGGQQGGAHGRHGGGKALLLAGHVLLDHTATGAHHQSWAQLLGKVASIQRIAFGFFEK